MKESEVENLLRDMQEYRELTNRLKAIFGDQMTLKDMVDVMERIIREPGRKDPVNARILTYDEAAMWDEYRKIGTVEECRAAAEKSRKIAVLLKREEEREESRAVMKQIAELVIPQITKEGVNDGRQSNSGTVFKSVEHSTEQTGTIRRRRR